MIVSLAPSADEPSPEASAADFAVLVGRGEQRPGGSADCVAEDEHEALALVRDFLGYLPSTSQESPPRLESDDDPARRNEAMIELVPFESGQPYDLRNVLAEIVDGGSSLELQPWLAPRLLTVLARLDGRTVGVVASEPAHGEALVGLELCAKLARFVRLCDAFHVPLVYLVDLPAGEGAGEQAVPGDSGDVAIMSAVMETVDYTQRATVPKVVLLTGGAYGLAAALLGAVDARSDCVLAWPRATIARSLSAGERAGLSPSDVEEQISVLRAAKAGRVIELIDPRETRATLVRMLDLYDVGDRYTPRFKHRSIVG